MKCVASYEISLSRVKKFAKFKSKNDTKEKYAMMGDRGTLTFGGPAVGVSAICAAIGPRMATDLGGHQPNPPRTQSWMDRSQTEI